ncbi:MAG: DUF4157 domain-containing protein [Synechococcaceae cyanobacterium]|nr:DUF4157 domain-containing protein [Synechococcaceae cyanobacterium]
MAEQSQRQASQQPAEEQSRQRQAGPRSRAALQDLQQPMDPLQRLQALANDSPQVAQLRGLQGLANHSPQVAQLRRLQELANNSPQATELRQLQALANGPERRAEAEPTTTKPEATTGKPEPAKPKPNLTGLPDQLKSNIEALSGLSMDAVRVHYNSTKPAQLNALAYAQGSDIHLAPGQERHLPHEAWHVVQQAQGRVRPTLQMAGGVAVNDDAGLEREADVMGRGAVLPGSMGAQMDEKKARPEKRENKSKLEIISKCIQKQVDEMIKIFLKDNDFRAIDREGRKFLKNVNIKDWDQSAHIKITFDEKNHNEFTIHGTLRSKIDSDFLTQYNDEETVARAIWVYPKNRYYTRIDPSWWEELENGRITKTKLKAVVRELSNMVGTWQAELISKGYICPEERNPSKLGRIKRA